VDHGLQTQDQTRNVSNQVCRWQEGRHWKEREDRKNHHPPSIKKGEIVMARKKGLPPGLKKWVAAHPKGKKGKGKKGGK
jgi:hypothetical protein